jgi:hypothetical protein
VSLQQDFRQPNCGRPPSCMIPTTSREVSCAVAKKEAPLNSIKMHHCLQLANLFIARQQSQVNAAQQSFY